MRVLSFHRSTEFNNMVYLHIWPEEFNQRVVLPTKHSLNRLNGVNNMQMRYKCTILCGPTAKATKNGNIAIRRYGMIMQAKRWQLSHFQGEYTLVTAPNPTAFEPLLKLKPVRTEKMRIHGEHNTSLPAPRNFVDAPIPPSTCKKPRLSQQCY